MPAYVIAAVDVHNQARYDEYRQLVPATIERYGGRFLARGGALDVLEGEWPKRVVIIEFDSMQRAREWHDSAVYAGPIAIRNESARTNMIIVEGL
jgi:uncharacterized protein (DUF1330 family)